jgi:hypothetical protein
MQTDKQIFEWMTNSDCYRALNAIDRNKVMKKLKGEPAVPPKSNLAKAAFYLAERIHIASGVNPPNPDPPIVPTDPPTEQHPPRYAPRTHNLGGRDQDPRFCCKPEYGVKEITHPVHGVCYEDEQGCLYDKEHMMNLDGRRDRGWMVPELKGADSMDSMEPCDTYVHEGRTIPPYPGDPYRQTGSYHR